ncbi:MAG: carboxypeptidase regulatory-like domain-containing protein [Oceanospirillaceae bacterium]|nr:carboxypeptidase regulatory-like domain-containing protein [Oceanospirillaceae bacterium]
MPKVLFVVIFSFFCTQVNAHLLKVFAYSQPVNSADDLLVKGKVYFAGGERLGSAPIDILTTQGNSIKQLMTDNQGNFTFTLPVADYTIIVKTNDGHRATWAIKSATTTIKPILNIPAQDELISHRQMSDMFALQLAAQIAPLSEQINDLQDKAKYQDIIGAIGYIFGAFGLFTWFRQRKTS